MDKEKLKEGILKARQGAVAKTGNDWEKYVEDFLRVSFNEIKKEKLNLKIIEDIAILRMGKKSEMEQIRRKYPKLYQALLIPIVNFAKNKEFLLKNLDIISDLFENSLIGDTDIVVFSNRYEVPIVIISCKVSLHGRLTETLFYSLYYRITNKIKFILVTSDKGKQAEEGKWESEWGSVEHPSKDRIMAALFSDGVYVDNVSTFMPRGFNPSNKKTQVGGIIRELTELPLDIIRWYEDIKFSINNNKHK